MDLDQDNESLMRICLGGIRCSYLLELIQRYHQLLDLQRPSSATQLTVNGIQPLHSQAVRHILIIPFHSRPRVQL